MDVLAGGLTRDVAVGYAVRDGPSRGVGASVAAVVFRSGLGVGCADAHRRRCVFIRMTAFFIDAPTESYDSLPISNAIITQR